MLRIRQTGFTLVEILIVVVILGILAAIVIPQFSNASEAAKASSLKTTLQTFRTQLELYQNQHNGEYPDGLTTDWTQLTEKTNAAGTVGTTAGTHIYGPYVQKELSNPFFSGTTATAVSATATYTDNGWAYTQSDGTVKANVPSSVDSAALGVDDSDDFNVQTGS